MSHSIFSKITSIPVALAILVLICLIAVGFRVDTLPYSPESFFSDATISRYPDALHFRRSLLEHHTLPLWNAHLMGGQPFAANPGAKVWYPLTWLLLIWEPALHINILSGFHLWFGAMGMWCWARRTGLQAGSALLATVGYVLAPKLIAHMGVGHLDLLIAMAWTPWLLYFLHHTLTEGRTPFNILGLAFSVAMIFIGAIQLTPFMYGLGFVYAVKLFSQMAEKINTGLKSLALSGGLSIGFTAVLWLPLLELREAVSRGNIREVDAALFSLQPSQFVGMLIGDHGGSAETLTYVGISIMLLAGLGLLLRPRENQLWWTVIVFAALYALGDNFFLWSGLVKLFPPLLLFRVPSRIWFLVALLMPYLAGWGMQFLLEKPPDTAPARLGIVALVGLGLTCGLASQFMFGNSEIKMTALIGIFMLPMTALLIGLAIFRKVEPRYLIAAFIVLVAVDYLWIDRTLIEGRPESEWLQKEPPALIADLATTGERVYTPDYSIPQQDTAYWGIARFDGVDPFQITNFIDVSVKATGVPRAGYSTTVPAVVVLEDDESSQQYKNAPMDARLLGQWGVAWVVTGYEINIDGLELQSQIDGVFFYENDSRWGDAVALEWLSPNKVKLNIENDYPNMKAVAEEPRWWHRSDRIALETDTYSYTYPKGSTTIEYQGKIGTFTGIAITILTYLIALGWLTWGLMPRAR